MNSRRTTLIVAVVLAIAVGWLTLNYLSSVQHQADAEGAPRSVLVAAQEIPARVTIVPAMLTTVTRPASAVDPDAISDPAQAVGALSLITIPAGAAITTSKIGHPADVGLPVRLTPGMRAVSIAVDKVKGVSGLIEPGDLVDVIADAPRGNGLPPHAVTILRGIRILAIGDQLEYSSATPSPSEENATTVTLEVTPKQADLLTMADLNTTLRLALRSPKEPINSLPAEALELPAGSSGAPVASAPAPLEPAAAMQAAVAQMQAQRNAGAAAPQHPQSGVPVIDGDRYTDGGT